MLVFGSYESYSGVELSTKSYTPKDSRRVVFVPVKYLVASVAVCCLVLRVTDAPANTCGAHVGGFRAPGYITTGWGSVTLAVRPFDSLAPSCPFLPFPDTHEQGKWRQSPCRSVSRWQ